MEKQIITRRSLEKYLGKIRKYYSSEEKTEEFIRRFTDETTTLIEAMFSGVTFEWEQILTGLALKTEDTETIISILSKLDVVVVSRGEDE